MNAIAPTSEERAEKLQGLGCKRKRVEDIRFVQGKGNYVDDLKLPGTLYGDLVRSPHAHARIKSIDVSKAMKVPGVLAVLTAKELKPLALHYMPTLAGDVQAVLAEEKVLFQNQEVAFVVAETREAAADAVDLVEVAYEALPVVIDPFKAMAPDAPVLREDIKDKTDGAHGKRIARFSQIDGYRCLSLMRASGGCEAPIGLGVIGVAVVLPGGDLVSEDLFIGDAAVETLGRQDAEFRLRQIEPAAVLWRVTPFEPLDQPPGFGGREGLVERRLAVDVEIVLDQNDCPGVGEVDIGEVFQDMSVIHGGVTIRHLDAAPAFERREQHEEVGGPIALVLVVATGRAARFHRDRQARLGDELL